MITRACLTSDIAWSWCAGRAYPQAGQSKKKEPPAVLVQTPCRCVLVLYLGQINISRHGLGCVTARTTSASDVGGGGGPSRPLWLLLIPREGVSMMGATTSLNASVTPTAVLVDASMNRHLVRAAKAAPFDVGSSRVFLDGVGYVSA